MKHMHGLATAFLLILPATAMAWPQYSFSSGQRAAQAEFSTYYDSGLNTNILKVVLTNTAAFDTLVPADVLTAVFFNAGSMSLTKLAAVLNTGSSVIYDPDGQPAGGVVGGEWAYGTASSIQSNTGYGRGISATGLGSFGPGDRFPGANLSGPPSGSPGGVDYGLVSAGDNPATGNGGLKNSGGLIKNSVIFTLSYAGPLLSEAQLLALLGNTVAFQYGSNYSEPRFTGTLMNSGGVQTDVVPLPVPEPGSIALAALGALGFLGYGLRRRFLKA
jgi:hypothetical protein